MSEIVCVGICTVDAIGRIIDEYPPPGGLRLFDHLTIATGGNAVNCSIALAKMGIACSLIVKVGDDMLGRFVLDEARRHNIDISSVIRDKAGTSTPFTFVCGHASGQRSFLHTMGTNATLQLDEIDMHIVSRAKFCFVTGTMVMKAFDGPQTAEMLRRTKTVGVTTLLDTVYVDSARNWREIIEPCLPHLDYFIPSEPEACAITGETEPARMARALQAKGCRNAVIKMGPAGAFWRDAAGAEGLCPAFAVPKVVDTTGAGDCWSAGFLTGLSRGEALPQAVDLGNATAAFGIQSPGASTGIRPLGEILQFRSTAKRNDNGRGQGPGVRGQ
jgi:sugar/nucleoside kinase (ribokinase family)